MKVAKGWANNNEYYFPYGGRVDEHGNPVKRTKEEYPYSYDGFVQERVHPNSKSTGTVYTDRLLQWDYTKTRKLLKKHFESISDKGGDYWSGRSAESIQKFLRDWFADETIVVTLVMEYCNVSNGYPTWRIDYFHENSKPI